MEKDFMDIIKTINSGMLVSLIYKLETSSNQGYEGYLLNLLKDEYENRIFISLPKIISDIEKVS